MFGKDFAFMEVLTASFDGHPGAEFRTVLGIVDNPYNHQRLFYIEIAMKIAVASQNRKEITSHTGRCRKFWIYHIENNEVTTKEMLELPKEQSFHESSRGESSPLDNVQVLIAGGMGSGLVRRLEEKNIRALITKEMNPDQAVNDFLKGALKTEPAEPHEHGHRHR